MSIPDQPRGVSTWGLRVGLASLLLLVALALYLGATRIYQVDEAQNVMTARLIGAGNAELYTTGAPLMVLGPLTWLARRAVSSADLFFQVRMVFLALMGLNLVLMVKAAGLRLRSPGGLLVLLAGATLAPLWDYGFEIRHDNLMLTGILAVWAVYRRPGGPGLPGLFAVGTVAGLLQILAFKSFLYWIPLLACGLAWFAPTDPRGRWRSGLAMLAGLAAGLLAARVLHGLSDTWHLYVSDFHAARAYSSTQVQRFGPWPALGRLLRQAPLVVGALAAGFLHMLKAQRQGGWKAHLDKEGIQPETAFAAFALAAFLINPTPFPYNLVLLVPSIFVLGVRLSAGAVREVLASSRRDLVLCLFGAAHLLPWCHATLRHLDHTNARQVQLMSLSERMTDPARHAVFDGSGLVPTRKPPGSHWLVHSFTISRLSDGTWPSIRSQLGLQETPVILPNYRLQGLPGEDEAFIKAHYVALAGDFRVLGTVGRGGSTDWVALAEGRYELRLLKAPPDAKAEVDGALQAPGVLHLSKGPHRIKYPEGSLLQLVWLGPRLEALPALPDSAEPLFLNWY